MVYMRLCSTYWDMSMKWAITCKLHTLKSFLLPTCFFPFPTTRMWMWYGSGDSDFISTDKSNTIWDGKNKIKGPRSPHGSMEQSCPMLRIACQLRLIQKAKAKEINLFSAYKMIMLISYLIPLTIIYVTLLMAYFSS